jgi:hypothetical protein
MPDNSHKELFKRIISFSAGTVGFTAAAYFISAGEWRKGFITGGITFLAVIMRIIWRFIGRTKEGVEKIINEEKAPRIARWIVDTSERYLLMLWWTLTSRFTSKYYKNLVYRYRTYRTLGISIRGKFTFDFEEIFVPLRVDIESLEKISSSMIQPESQKEGLNIWDFLAAANKNPAYQRIAIIGAPGSGKTTLLEHVALTYAQNKQRHQHRKAPNLIPVLLTLRDLKNQVSSDGQPILSEVLEKQEWVKRLKPRAGWFEQKLKKKKVLVMLDGLDEIADPTERKTISDWVNIQMGIYPNTTFVLTSRPFGYKSAPIEQIRVVLEVQPLGRRQMERFIRNWYVQSEIMHQVRKADAGVVEVANIQADDLINRVRHNADLLLLAFNPLLLTMIATVHDNSGALPRTRIELYSEICDVLLGRRQEAKRMPINLVSVQKKAVLQVLALTLMVDRTREFTLLEGVAIIKDILATVSSNTQTPEQFIERAEKISGILIEKEAGIYEFAHKSFQEYLAAVQIKETNQEQILLRNINDQWWEETIRLYAAQTDATNIISAAIDSLTIHGYTLTYDCLEEGVRVAPTVRQQFYENLASMLEGENREWARLAAEVILSRRLKNLLPTSGDVVLDPNYITAAEYQLFIDETQSRKVFNQPDHWSDFRFPRGSGRSPILGMRIDSAISFCRWLTARHNSPDFKFRLPTTSESCKDFDCATLIGCWCLEGEEAKIGSIDQSKVSDIKSLMLKAFEADINYYQLPIPSDELPAFKDYILNSKVISVFGIKLGHQTGINLGYNFGRLFEPKDFKIALSHIFAREHLKYKFTPDNQNIGHRISTLNRIMLDIFSIRDSVDVFGFEAVYSTAFDRANDMDIRIPSLKIIRLSSLVSFFYWTWLLEILQKSIERIPRAIANITLSQWAIYNENILKYEAQKESALHTYAIATMILGRQSGIMPPFEGIRIVKEFSDE